MRRDPKLNVYRDRTGGWRWRLLAGNGKIIADSAEAYTTKRKAQDSAIRASDAFHLIGINIDIGLNIFR